jgi:hypothetical protein
VLGDTLRADPVLGQSDPRHVSVDYLRRPDGRERYDALCRAAARLGRQMRRVRARSATGESVGFPAMWGAVWRKIHQRPRLGRMGPVWQFDSRRSARSATASLPGAQDHSVSSQDDTLQASREEAANRAPKADDPSAPCCSRPHGRCLPHPLRCFVPSAGAEA